MTVSSVDIHGVTSISVDEVLELYRSDGFNSIIHARHIKITCTDSQGGTHHHTINVYGDTAEAVDFTFTHKEEK